jgi:prolipoprotein diacylglyceryltransferase
LLAVLLTFHPLRKSPGQVMAVMMIGYAVHRYLNELLRSDNRPVGFESYFSVLLLVGGVVMFVWLQWRPVKVEGPGEAKTAP